MRAEGQDLRRPGCYSLNIHRNGYRGGTVGERGGAGGVPGKLAGLARRLRCEGPQAAQGELCTVGGETLNGWRGAILVLVLQSERCGARFRGYGQCGGRGGTSRKSAVAGVLGGYLVRAAGKEIPIGGAGARAQSDEVRGDQRHSGAGGDVHVTGRSVAAGGGLNRCG